MQHIQISSSFRYVSHIQHPTQEEEMGIRRGRYLPCGRPSPHAMQPGPTVPAHLAAPRNELAKLHWRWEAAVRGSATGEGGASARKERHRRRRGRSVAVAGRDERRRPSGGGSAVGRRVMRETRGDFSFFISRGIAGVGWADGRTKTNIAPKFIHTLFFLVVGDLERRKW